MGLENLSASQVASRIRSLATTGRISGISSGSPNRIINNGA